MFSAPVSKAVCWLIWEKNGNASGRWAGITWISSDTFAFSRELQDSDLRGTWFQKVGEREKRVSLEPFIVNKKGGLIMFLPSSELVVFLTNVGILKVKKEQGVHTLSLQAMKKLTKLLQVSEWSTTSSSQHF